MRRRARRLLIPLSFLAPLCAGLATAPAHALEPDRQLPFQVKADAVELDQKTGSSVYRGHVVLSQGSMRIEADRVEVRSPGRRLNTVIAVGKPVRVRALIEDSFDELRADANRVEFRATEREVELTGGAWVRQAADQIRAERITIGLDDKRMSASGTDTGDGRVYAIFHPKRKSEKP
jgi:lipopolysaccharide export system protein LptA